jgi:hypothetical protein
MGGDEVSGMQICCMDLDGANSERITDGVAVLKINVAGDWIYYATGSELHKIKTNGTEQTKLCDFPGAYSNLINVLDDWVYIWDRASGMHRVKTDGSEFQEVT